MIEIIIFLFSGIFIGIVAGLFGLGGGLLIVPVVTYSLIYFSKIASDQAILIAISTSLASMIMTGAMAVYAHTKNTNIDYKIIKKFLLGLIIGSIFTGYFFKVIPGDYLKNLFILYTLFTAYRLFNSNVTQKKPKLPGLLWTNFVGLFFSMISGILGIGGGTLFTPYLIKYNVPSRLAIGTSSAFGFFIGLFASITVFISSSSMEHNNIPLFGYIYIPAIIFLTLPSLVFVNLSAGWLLKISDAKAKHWFASLLLIIGVSMALQ